MDAVDAQKSQAHIPVCELGNLTAADAIIFGTPTRFGNMCGQMRQFLDSTGGLLHHGMIIVGLPYSFEGQMQIDEITGGSPYGASTIAGGDGKRLPSINELDAASFQGRHVAQIATKLVR